MYIQLLYSQLVKKRDALRRLRSATVLSSRASHLRNNWNTCMYVFHHAGRLEKRLQKKIVSASSQVSDVRILGLYEHEYACN